MTHPPSLWGRLRAIFRSPPGESSGASLTSSCSGPRSLDSLTGGNVPRLTRLLGYGAEWTVFPSRPLSFAVWDGHRPPRTPAAGVTLHAPYKVHAANAGLQNSGLCPLTTTT